MCNNAKELFIRNKRYYMHIRNGIYKACVACACTCALSCEWENFACDIGNGVFESDKTTVRKSCVKNKRSSKRVTLKGCR